MAIYKYVARNMDRKRIKGKLEAENRKELATFLRSKGQFLIDCEDITNLEKNTYKLSLQELSDFSRQLATMIASGVSLIRAMSILVQREDKRKIKAIYTDIYRKLQQGQTLSMAMEEQQIAFPPLMINMYRSGESSGQLEKIAFTMAIQYEKDHRINTKIRNAMIYPIILIVITVFVIVALFTWIIPSFSSVMKSNELPMITVVMNKISDYILHGWYWILIVILSMVAIFLTLLRNDKFKFYFDKFKLSIPRLGKILRTIYTARFSRNMCSLYISGLSVMNAMTIVKDTIGNQYIESQFEETMKMIRNGNSLSQSIQKIQGFDTKLASSIYIGEESGKLEDMLNSLADDFDYEAEMTTQKIVAILEPIMIIILAVLVLIVMLSVLLPIYQMYQNPIV